MSVGARLQEVRKERKFSISEVSRETKIQPWVLEALEADRLQEGMSPIYVKGFLATYARFLGLESEPLVAQLRWPEEELVQSQGPSPPSTPSWAFQIPWDRLRRFRTPSLIALGLTALVVLRPLRWVPSLHVPHREASVSGVRSDPPTVSPDVLAGRSGQRHGGAASGAGASGRRAGPLELSVVVRRSTWIRVRADGKLLNQRQLPRGTQETWTADKRLEVVIGNPSQVDVVLNGQPISPLAAAHRGRLLITPQGVVPLPESE